MMGEYVGGVPQHVDDPVSRSQIAIQWVIMLLVCLGYHLNMTKSVLFPTQVLTFLRMIVDSVHCSFFITEKTLSEVKTDKGINLKL